MRGRGTWVDGYRLRTHRASAKVGAAGSARHGSAARVAASGRTGAADGRGRAVNGVRGAVNGTFRMGPPLRRGAADPVRGTGGRIRVHRSVGHGDGFPFTRPRRRARTRHLLTRDGRQRPRDAPRVTFSLWAQAQKDCHRLGIPTAGVGPPQRARHHAGLHQLWPSKNGGSFWGRGGAAITNSALAHTMGR